jgi:hypothetical protein
MEILKNISTKPVGHWFIQKREQFKKIRLASPVKIFELSSKQIVLKIHKAGTLCALKKTFFVDDQKSHDPNFC